MKVHSSQAYLEPDLAILAWENDGGAKGRENIDHLYGRRIEPDRTWTIYHVFTGVPAHVGGHAMMGLSRLQAGKNMLALNLCNERRRQERTDMHSGSSPRDPETEAARP